MADEEQIPDNENLQDLLKGGPNQGGLPKFDPATQQAATNAQATPQQMMQSAQQGGPQADQSNSPGLVDKLKGYFTGGNGVQPPADGGAITAVQQPQGPQLDPNAPATPVSDAMRASLNTTASAPSGPSVGLATQATSTTTQQGLDLSKSQQKLNQAVDAQQKAVDANIDVQRTQADYQATALQEKSDLFKQYSDQAKVRNEDYQKQLSTAQNQVQGQYDLLKSSTVKPNQLYENLSTGSKIQAGLAIGLGALGAAFTGGPNQALGIIQNAIDRDIDTQKANVGIREKAFGASQTAYSTLAKNLGDKELAANMLEKRAYESVGQQLDAQLATTKDSEALAKGQELKANIMAKQAEIQERIDTATSAKVSSTAQQGIAPLGPDGKPIYLPPADIQARMVTYPNGNKMLAGTAEGAGKMQDVIANNQSLNGVIDKMLALREKNGINVLPSADKAQMESLQGVLKAKLKEALGFRALTDTDEKLIENMQGGDANGIGQVVARLNELKSNFNEDANNMLHAKGLAPLGGSYGGQGQNAGMAFMPNNPKNRATFVSNRR